MLQKRLADETEDGGRFRRRDVDAAIRQVIGGGVDASEVIDLFAAAGLEVARLDILGEQCQERVPRPGARPADRAGAQCCRPCWLRPRVLSRLG